MMHRNEFITYLSGLKGVLRVERLERSVVGVVADMEDSIREVTAGMRLENSGMATCASCDDVFVILADGDFPRPEAITMEMVDDRGVTVGHDVPPSQVERYRERDDVIWISDNFVLFPLKLDPHDVRMVMRATRMEVPFDHEPWIFYPSPETADTLNTVLGVGDRTLSTIVVGVNGLDDGSVPVTDVVEVPAAGCGHGEPTPEDPLDACDLVSE